MAIISIPGESSGAPADPGINKFLNVQVLHAGVVSPAARGGGPVPPPKTVDVPDDAIIAVEYADGLKLWMRADDYQAQPRLAAARGGMDWAVKALQAFQFNPAETLGEAAGEYTAMKLIENFESKLSPGPGLYGITDVFTQSAPIKSKDDLKGPGKILLFFHGTASNTQGSFSGLALTSSQTPLSILRPTTPEFERLRRTYGDRILAYEHSTLSKSPVDNVMELLDKLPDGATLHLVSHSRGGLLGELLCLNQELTDDRLRPIYERDRAKDADQLKALSHALLQKKFKIERFVRVACPTRGTILASKRLDLYLSGILNLAGLIPGFEGNPFYDFFKASALALIKARTEPDKVPGVEAMMPESPLIHLLNQRTLQSQADLAVIAGDIQGEGLVQRLKVFLTDIYYLTRHDLVVDTDSMYCGLGRANVAHYFFDRGPNVNHFQYFANGTTRELLMNWLTREKIADAAGFKELTAANLALDRSQKRGELPADAPILFFVPGFLGTQLQDASGPVWLDFDALALGAYARLSNGHQKGELLGHPYQALIEFLSQHFEVIEFGYEWTKSLAELVPLLEAEVNAAVAKGRTVRVLSHSSGSLLARAISPELWTRMKGNLVMLGALPDGSYWPVEVISGRAPFIRQLELLDYAHRSELRSLIASWPGLLEMLPEKFLSPQAWTGLEHVPDLNRLQAAAKARSDLPRHDGAIVAGAAPRTPGVVSGKLDYTEPGDGRVLWQTLPKANIWYADAPHGELANLRSAFLAIVELIKAGHTDKLPSKPRQLELDKSPDVPVLFPDEAELLDAALGGCSLTEIKPDLATLKVRVLHGDMSKAEYPVMVGHYRGDTIVSAEQRLDTLFDGLLSRRFQAGIYPGPLNSNEVILSSKTPSGAIIVGLGGIGELNEEKLRSTVLHAMLRYAMILAEQPLPPDKRYHSASVASVLIGTYGGEAVDEECSVTSIVHAALEANRVLRTQKLWNQVRIEQVQFIEVYEDLATQAMHAALRLPDKLRTELGKDEQIEVAPHLEIVEGSRDRRPANQYSTGWWRRIQVTGRENAEGVAGIVDLKFNVLTDRARTEESLSIAQTRRVDAFVERAIHSPADDQQTNATLFELLLPRSLKQRSNEFTNLVLELDHHSAQYPWELLASRSRGEFKPLAATAGLIRQFKTDKPEEPRSTRENRAFVAAFPNAGNPAKFPELRGAAMEAEQIRDFLTTAGYGVSPKLASYANSDGNYEILSHLLTGDYRFLHLAGHGIDDPAGLSGLVIKDGDIFTAEDVANLRYTPDLVFLNCCHLGSIGLPRANRLAASLSQSFIEKGCRAVVAAGWAVDDQAAVAFAKKFYAAMLRGQSFGNAVFEARKAVRQEFPNTNTWGAYQCYGNPGYRIEVLGPANPLRPDLTPCTFNEFVERCRSFAADPRKTRDDVEALLQSVPSAWSDDGRLLAAFGEAFQKLGCFERAVQMYERAVNDPKAQAPIAAIQSLANLQTRYAKALRETVKNGNGSKPTGMEMINQAIRRLEWLMMPQSEKYIALDETVERLSVLGGAYRRKALFQEDERHANLEKARDAYGKAYELARRLTSEIDTYPALNWISLRFILGEQPASLKNDLDQITAAAEKQAAGHKPFWKRIARPDSIRIRAMIEGKLSDRKQDIVAAYKEVLGKDGNDLAQVESITGGIEELSELLADQPTQALLRDIVADIRAI